MTHTLSLDKEEAAIKVADFLLDPELRIFILNGAPGVGKSFFIDYIIKKIYPMYLETQNILLAKNTLTNLEITATTNPAANLLGSDAITIHKLLGLKVNRAGGLVQPNRPNIENSLIIIDEYTMIDRTTKAFIESDILPKNKNNKLILVGDPDQFLSIGASNPSFHAKIPNTSSFELTVNNRTNKKGIIDSCNILRSWIRNEPNQPDWDIDGVDVSWSDKPLEECFQEMLKKTGSNSCLTYKNQEVHKMNRMARDFLGKDSFFEKGDEVVVNTAVYLVADSLFLPTDSILYISGIDPNPEIFTQGKLHCIIDTYYVSNYSRSRHFKIKVLRNPEQYTQGQIKNLTAHPGFAGRLVDIRSRYSRTFHKAQGSSLDHVLVDLSSFPSNISRDTLLRALYVAISRAKQSVTLVGELHESLKNKL